jgi:hypothetical protein
MALVLVQFDDSVVAPDGRAYTPRACGAEVDGLWQGWIEFEPVGGGETLRTTRETTQPNRDHLVYWAEGLTHVYLEGALWRALELQPPSLRPRQVDVSPAYDRPAEDLALRPAAEPISRGRPVLDPFQVYPQGERVLQQELGALDLGHLRDIARFHALVDRKAAERMTTSELIHAIVTSTAEIFERAHAMREGAESTGRGAAGGRTARSEEREERSEGRP